MAFVCTLPPAGRFESDLFEGNGEHITRSPIGYDLATTSIFSMELVLAPEAGYYPDGFELTFSILEYSAKRRTYETHRDGLETKKVIPSAVDRELIMVGIASMSAAFVQRVRPPILFMRTRLDGLPAKALLKYYVLRRVLTERAGYVEESENIMHGGYTWKMVHHG